MEFGSKQWYVPLKLILKKIRGDFMKNMMFTILTVVLLSFGLNMMASAQAGIPPADKQIKAAVSAAPEEMQAKAKVLGYNAEGDLVTLRKGDNKLICLADNPNEDRFHVACYHKDLEPFMKRGRELRAEGKSRDEITEIRRQEIESGDIPMPEKPMALYSLTGPADGYDYEKEIVQEARPLYVVYIPYATEESTGMAPKPVSDGAPWLMDPGTPWAHIMVSTGEKIGVRTNGNK